MFFFRIARIEETVKSFPNELALLDDGSGATYTYQAEMCDVFDGQNWVNLWQMKMYFLSKMGDFPLLC